jgi:HAE1 family hydrophobic/amphiphilic exporter-1
MKRSCPPSLAGVREVSTAVTASTITTVARDFLPIALVGGLTGELFRPFASRVTMALLASLLISLTHRAGAFAYWFLGNRKVEHKHGGEMRLKTS